MFWGAPAVVAAAPAAEDPYLAGYAGAVLEREFKVARRAVTVDNGVLTLDGAQLTGTVAPRSSRGAGTCRGSVEVREASGRGPAVVPDVAPAAVSALPTGFLPAGHLFQPLLADPRWPHFSASYRYYLNNRDLEHVGAVSFGETIPLIRGNGFADGQWEAASRPAYSRSSRWIRRRRTCSTPTTSVVVRTWRRGSFSALGRIFHQSSHLGDELLLRTRLERINLTYESVDLKLSYDVPFGLRVYGGGGYLFNQEPASLKPWAVQGGVEFRSPLTIAAGHIGPVAAVDLQSREENRWNLDVSVRAGIQLENVRVLERNLQLLVEYFHGNSPDGQFYKQRIDYLGLGAHFHF